MKKLLLNVPWADLRTEPETRCTTHQGEDPHQETQALLGEQLVAHEESDGWVRVEAIEQPIYRESKWIGYGGWIAESDTIEVGNFPETNHMVTQPWVPVHSAPRQKSELLMYAPLGARLRAKKAGEWASIVLPDGREGWCRSEALAALESLTLPETQLRKRLVELSLPYLGHPYLWGGRTIYTQQFEGRITGNDCSGLTHLAHRLCGIDIPRNAAEQLLKSRPLDAHPQPGDLVFLAKSATPTKIFHVMFCVDDNTLLEATQLCWAIRTISAEERLGKRLSAFHSGEHNGTHFIYFGSYVSTHR